MSSEAVKLSKFQKNVLIMVGRSACVMFAAQALQHYGKVSGPHQETAMEAHTQLRRNLLRTVVREYQRTGFLWENYDDEDGHGRGTHPFTGWSALFVLS